MRTLAPFIPMSLIEAALREPRRLSQPAVMRSTIDETDNAYLLRLVMPGVAPEHIALELTGPVLRIDVDSRSETERADGSFTLAAATRFGQAVRLPDDVDREAIAAGTEHGVLTIRLPKAAAVTRRIPVEASVASLEAASLTSPAESVAGSTPAEPMAETPAETPGRAPAPAGEAV